jgi:hypothetical protein
MEVSPLSHIVVPEKVLFVFTCIWYCSEYPVASGSLNIAEKYGVVSATTAGLEALSISRPVGAVGATHANSQFAVIVIAAVTLLQAPVEEVKVPAQLPLVSENPVRL